jgi:thiol-disulfide isomerase/thioredoxin
MNRFFLPAALSALLFSCTSPSRQTTLSGSFESYRGEQVYVNLGHQFDTLAVNASNGTFVWNPSVDSLTTAHLIVLALPEYVLTPFRIAPGNRIGIRLVTTADGKPAVRFSGDEAAVNNYLYAYTTQTGLELLDAEAVAAQSFRQYAAATDSLIASLQALLNQVPDGREKSDLQARLDLTAQTRKFYWVRAATYLRHTPVDADPDFVRFAGSIPVNDLRVVGEQAGSEVSYTDLVDSKLMWEGMRNPAKYGREIGVLQLFRLIGDFVTNNEVRIALANKYMSDYLEMNLDASLDETFAAYRQLVPGENRRRGELEEKYRAVSELSPGRPAPDFNMTDTQGRITKLSDLRGKLLYIDVWATWCGPCKQEIPFMKKLYEKYRHNPNVAFVSISVDNSERAWLKAMERDQPAWPNYRAEGGFNGALSTQYRIEAIPRFMLIDRKGNILNVNAEAPSSDEIEALLKHYL